MPFSFEEKQLDTLSPVFLLFFLPLTVNTLWALLDYLTRSPESIK